MDYISVYQGSTKTVNVNLTNPDSTPYNASGAVLYFTVKQNYTDANNFFSLVTTGLGDNLTNALTGLMTFNLTTGETTLCAGDYPGSLLLVDVNSGRSPMPVGYTVSPAVLP
jgi:hypothetical protein